jgi:hypothetical protein
VACAQVQLVLLTLPVKVVHLAAVMIKMITSSGQVNDMEMTASPFLRFLMNQNLENP